MADADRPRTLRTDLERVRALLEWAVEAHPLAVASTAAGIGFALGGGWTAARLVLLLQAGSRVATTWLGEAIRERGQENVDATH
jgi:hypothetical protein